MNLQKEFLLYPEAFELKQLGFNEPCFVYWVFNNVEITFSTTDNRSGWSMIGFTNSQMSKKAGLCTAPTYSQAFRFFREFREYDDWPIESWIQPYLSDEPRQHEAFYWRRGEKVSVGVFSTHDEAQLNLLRKLIEIVKTNQ